MNKEDNMFIHVLVLGGDNDTKYSKDFWNLLKKHIYNKTNLLRYFKYLEHMIFQNKDKLDTKYEHINLYANILEVYAFTDNVIKAFGTIQDLINFLDDTLEFQEHFFKSIVRFHAVTLDSYDLEIRNEDNVIYHFGDFNTLKLWEELGSYCRRYDILFDLILFDKSTVKFTSFTVQTLQNLASFLSSDGIVYIENSNSKIRYINFYGRDAEDENKFSALINQVNTCNYKELFNCMISKYVKEFNFATNDQIPLLLGRATTDYALDDIDHIQIAKDYNHLEVQEYKQMMIEAKELFNCYVDQYNLQIFDTIFDVVEYYKGSYIDNDIFPIRSYYMLGRVKEYRDKQNINYRELLGFANV